MASLCKTLILIALSVLGLYGVAAEIQTETTKCLHKMIPDADVEVIASSPLPNWPIIKFKIVCGKKRIFDDCIKHIPKNPEEPSLEIIKRILQKKIDFLCGAGRDYYIHHKDCLAKDGVQGQVQTCADNFGKKYRPNKSSSQCVVIKEFRGCVRAASSICGSEAGLLVTKYMDFNVESFTGTPDCGDPFNAGTSTRFGFLNLMLPAVVVWMKLS